MRKLFWVFVLPLLLFAETKTPEQIAQELQVAEAQFQEAKKMFSPWYTGPLITPGASMMPPANGNSQPYLFFIDNYAAYNKDRKSVSLPSSLFQMKGTANVQTGITSSMDINVNFAAQGNWKNNHNSGGFGDINVTAGFMINKQTTYTPNIKFTVAETFPTGSYKQLRSDGLDGVGAGSFSTQFGVSISKVVLWNTKHPMNMRCFLGYQLSAPVNVRGFNVYGGGFGCVGKVRPGNSFSADFGYEVSITQKWVAALDVVYSATNRTKFHGHAGTLSDGTPSAVGVGYSDNLSLAPALEYNWNPNLGLIAGAWFSVYGRNSSNFAAGIISVTYSYP